MKQTIRLTESELRTLVNESVRRILKENEFGLDALPNTDSFDDDEYEGIGPELTPDERRAYMDDAYNEMDVKFLNNHDFDDVTYRTIFGDEDEYEPTEDDWNSIDDTMIAEAVKRAIRKHIR